MADSKKKSSKKTVKAKTKKSTAKKSSTKTSKKKISSKKTKISTVKKTTSKKKAVNKQRKPIAVESSITTKSKKTTAIKKIKEKKPSAKELKEMKEYEDEHQDPAAQKRGDSPMTVVGHLDEFRSRILISLVSVIVFTIIGFIFSDYLIEFINKPFKVTGKKLNIFDLTGGFVIKLKASLVLGFMISIPLLVFQIWRFIKPAITTKDRTFSRWSIVAAIFLFYGGMAFVFFGLLPIAIPMLLSFITKYMHTTIGANSYLSFVLLFSLAMGVLFELPIVMMILTKIGIITPAFLVAKRKVAIVIIFIVAAIITPQDILSQMLVAIPLMFLYEISIVISKIVINRKIKQQLKENQQS